MPWTLQSIRIDSVSPCDRNHLGDAVVFGHTLEVVLSLRYQPVAGLWEETPRLKWNETIIMVDHQQRERWEFTTDMYAHNPGAHTFRVWRRRYVEAFDSRPGGEVRLLDSQGMAVNFHGTPGMDAKQKAERVREYLRAFGGSLIIRLIDRPAIESRPGVQRYVERWLSIKCEVSGAGHSTRWAQHVEVNSALPRPKWVREASPLWHRQDLPRQLLDLPLNLLAYTRTEPPPLVSLRRESPANEAWGEYP